jgi:dihydrofolate reductase
MAKLTINTFLTLDGVMQAPGGPDEDRESGFEHGGWAVPYSTDEDFGEAMDDWMGRAGGLLLGRKTYEIFAGHWPKVTEGDYVATADRLNRLPKFVASKTLDKVEWNNSTLLEGDVAEAVAALKRQPGDEIQVHGSGNLAQTLIRHDLIDEYRLWSMPVVLGTGKRLFADGAVPAAMRLADTKTTSTGAVLNVYERAGAVEYGSFALDDE